MNGTKKEPIGICLFELPDQDRAVIQRVVTFSASQGKPYALHSDINDAKIIIALESIELPANTALIIRIGKQSASPCDILLQRPMLVSRVMRVLDDATRMLELRPTPTPHEQTPEHELELEATNPAEVVSGESESATEEKQQAPHEAVQLERLETELEPHERAEALLRAQGPMPGEAIEQPVTASAVINARPTEEITVPDTGEEGDHIYTALVVDDSAAIRKQLEIELSIARIEADLAETGEIALEKSAQKKYDLVFLDIIMLGIDGYEVCRQMRARGEMKKTPIIMLSGKTSPLNEVQGIIVGATTYLTKPIEREQFQKMLKRLSKWLGTRTR